MAAPAPPSSPTSLQLILWVAAALAFFAETRSPGEGMWQLGLAILRGDPDQWRVLVLAGISCRTGHLSLAQPFAAVRSKSYGMASCFTLAAELLVPGDIVLLEEGDNVPADCRLIAGVDEYG
jgi:sodium/potassium-transporting ATPase subunit alpha